MSIINIVDFISSIYIFMSNDFETYKVVNKRLNLISFFSLFVTTSLLYLYFVCVLKTVLLSYYHSIISD